MLTLVATPIGNMQDITLRALDELRAADVIAAEDTRKTGLLLARHGIKRPLIAYHEHNEAAAAAKLVTRMLAGERVAVVSNAGTPSLSDPGFRLVRLAIDAGIEVSITPGPMAAVAALAISGLPVHSFTFRGFPPRKPGPRRKMLEEDAASPHTLIYYESPHRLVVLLRDASSVLGDRPAALVNDLTKRFESVTRGTVTEIADAVTASPLKGEYVLLIAGRTRDG